MTRRARGVQPCYHVGDTGHMPKRPNISMFTRIHLVEQICISGLLRIIVHLLRNPSRGLSVYTWRKPLPNLRDPTLNEWI